MAIDQKRAPGESQTSLFRTKAGAAAEAGGQAGWAVAYTDGGSRGNPGPAGYGVLIQGPGGEVLAELSEFLGICTNNVAEYSGLLGALEFALGHGIDRLRVISDSELMVKQIRGQYRVQSPELRPLYEEARRRIARLAAFQIEHVLRGKNRRADELANRAMDRGMDRGMQRKSPPVEPPARAAAPAREPAAARPLRGIMQDGRVSLLEGSIPDGTIVVVMPEKALAARVSKPTA